MKTNNFIAIDFEMSYGHIPCSIGIVEFIEGKVVSKYYSLIKPIELKFSPINSRINGIKLEDVENEREFNEIWSDIKHYFDNRNIVAHNTSTDISVLEKTLKYYNLPSPNYNIFCTLKISQSILNLGDYKLSTIAKHLNIEQKNYHNALDDAFVCGEIFNYLIDESENINFNIPTKNNSLKKTVIKVTRDFTKISNNLENKTFLFTGKLSLFTRETAEEMVEKHGGKNISAVSKNLNYLVVGEKAGSKLKKAQEIGTIEILDEQQFLDLIYEQEGDAVE
ncbi:MAG TPA: hypothetical protein DIS75_05400 [Chryseobacterium sp.]|nr:hypothetical protein [Chryseobacterium sp.]